MDVQDLDRTVCYQAVLSRDSRFDGRFFVAVLTTGVYCRVSCRSRTPRAENVRFFRTGAEARAAGFRACRRCHPELLDPGAGAEDVVTSGAMGMMTRQSDMPDRHGVETLARQLGWSARHLQRRLGTEAGLTPHRLIRYLRLHRAVTRLTEPGVSLTRIALDAGFPSLRAFEAQVRETFGVSPGTMRGRALEDAQAVFWGPPLHLALPFRGPFDVAQLIRFLALRAVPGLEEGDAPGGRFRRALRLDHGLGFMSAASPEPRHPQHLPVTLQLQSAADLPAAVAAIRSLFDLDADTETVARALLPDPDLGPLVRRAPGLRVPGHVDGVEMAVRAILGQQISVEAARTQTARLVRLYGERVPTPIGTVDMLFPTAAALDQAGPELPGMAMPASRRRTIHGLAEAVTGGMLPDLKRGADPGAAGAALESLYGIGPWTRAYVAMRALGDPDAFLAGDLGVRQGYQALTGRALGVRELERVSSAWRPFRAYAVVYLWHALASAPTSYPLPPKKEAR
jgi:AraC family transcriptional regulator of adaptative response / DNA-3-methyladenine glycosylase II